MANITLSMIVKNEEKYLQDCLESVKDLVNEIVIVDTGSTDRTIEIAKQYNTKVYNFEWINDFSAARNFALSKSTGDWILYMDADERLDPDSKAEILRRTEKSRKIGFNCTVKSIESDGGRNNSIRYTRLFAYDPLVQFSGKVHEQIENSLKKSDYLIVDSKIIINHIGYNVSIDAKKGKAKRNLELLLSEYKQSPSPYYEFQLAHTYKIIEDEENAVKYFKRAAESPRLERIYRADSYASLALIAHTNHKIADAEKYIIHSLKLNDKQPFIYLLAAKISYRTEDYSKAEEKCKKAFELNKNISDSNDNSGLEFLIEPEEIIYFGLTIALKNRTASNIKYYQTELESIYKPRFPSEYEKYFQVTRKVIRNEKLEPDEINILDKITKKVNLNFYLFILNSYTDTTAKLEILERYNMHFVNDNEIIRMTAKTLDDLGRVDDAIEIIEKHKSDTFENPAIFFNLIALCIKKGDVNKLNSIVEYIEKNYHHIPEVTSRLTALKEKLKTFSSKKS
jgi:glycosyltransferase involved in cell wall biosynthesis